MPCEAWQSWHVGASGRIVGIEQSPDMIAKARRRVAFEIDFHPFPGTLLALASGTALLVLATGLAGSLPALRVRPVVYLREVTQE